MDNLIICDRCGSDACYVDEVNQDIKTYFCYGCGFQTNSLMKEGEDFYEQQSSVLAPAAINIEPLKEQHAQILKDEKTIITKDVIK